MSIEVIELFDILSKTFSKEDSQAIVKDIEALVTDHKRELATKTDLREVELKLIKEIELIRKEIEKAKSSTIKWVIGWITGVIIAQSGAIITLFTLLR